MPQRLSPILNTNSNKKGPKLLVPMLIWIMRMLIQQAPWHLASAPGALMLNEKVSLMDWFGTTHWFSFAKSTTLFTPDCSGEWSPYCAKGGRCFNEGWQLEFRQPN